MMEMMRKVFKGVCKSADPDNYTVEAVVSDETIDRYDDVILAKAWKSGLEQYKKHPVLLSSHNYYDLTSQIGVAEDVNVNTENKTLEATFKYFVNKGNPQADWGFTLAQEGLAAFSVGFVPKAVVTDPAEIASLLDLDPDSDRLPARVYTDVELLEVSQVLIPANPSALQKGIETSDDPVLTDLLTRSIEKIEQMEAPAELMQEQAEPTNDTDETLEPDEDVKTFSQDEVRVTTALEDLADAFTEIAKQVDSINEKLGKLDSTISEIIGKAEEAQIPTKSYVETVFAEEDLLQELSELTETLKSKTAGVAK